MNRRALHFTLLAYAFSWSLGLAHYFVRENRGASLALAVLFMFGPALAAVVLKRFVWREPVAPLGLRFNFGPAWLGAFLFPVLLIFGTMGASLLAPGVSFSGEMAGFFAKLKGALPPEQFARVEEKIRGLPVHLFWLSLVQALLAGATINAVAAFGEELGWRGLLFVETERLGFWRQSALIGVVWGVWHAPLILQGHNYPDHPVAGVFLFTVFCVLAAPLFGWIRARTGSVFAASVSHGVLNAVATLPPLVILGGDDLVSGVAGFPALGVLLLLNVALFGWTRVRPAAPAAETQTTAG
ncbi:MAG: CPBP family intramembrane glutamic endopeptidase [Myxococcales bacterium]